MKIVFATFADNKFIRSLERIETEAKQFSCFTDFYIFHQEDIDDEYLKFIKPYIYRRGFGYWRWKSYFAYKVLNLLNEGDVLVWADAGCTLSPESEFELLRIIDCAKKTKSGIAAFLQTNQIEKQWTKEDLFEYFAATEEERNSPQFWGGAWIMVKTKVSMKLLEEWCYICKNRGDLVTDLRSKKTNDICFVEHRHDQSVFSLLVKRTDAYRVNYEIDYIPQSPIKASRKKTKTKYVKMRERLLYPWRYILGCYLKHVKGFYFHNRTAW